MEFESILLAFGFHEGRWKLWIRNSRNLGVLGELDGPEGYWSPEAFFSASVSTCFILTFKAIARGKKLTWDSINVDVDAYLDKTGSKISFTRVDIFVTLTIPDTQTELEEIFLNALNKAEQTCLITNSINASIKLYPKIETKIFLI